MKHARKAALAASAFVCAAMFSFSWSEQSGVSLSVDNARAQSSGFLPSAGETPGVGYGQRRRANRRAAAAAGAAGAPYYAGVVRPDYAGGAGGYYTVPHYSPYNQYIADTTSGLSWYAVRAYYTGGPWYYGTRGWDDYAAQNGIGCTPGTLFKGGDDIMYVCQ